ncbi:unnamed protein product [Linum trigynum]|uniref:Uncharacterized protein n=1 Tax=Linum trigynum TaxID=586398 RepID=A0AAV2D857_9ROSI
MGSSSRPFTKTEPTVRQGRSPLQFPVAKGPRIHLRQHGRNTQLAAKYVAPDSRPGGSGQPKKEKKRGSRPTIAKPMLLDVSHGDRLKASPQPAWRESRTLASPTLSQAQEHSRRRRLILEQDSEDEFVVQPVPVKPPKSLSKSGSRAKKMGKHKSKAQGDGAPRGVDRAARQPVETARGDRNTTAGPPRRGRRLTKKVPATAEAQKELGNPCDAEMGVAPMEEGTSLDPNADVPIPGNMESEEDFSDADYHSFEIKRRELGVHPETEESQAGHVQKVVQAFESGVAVPMSPTKTWVRRPRAMEKPPQQQETSEKEDGQLGLNVYGSNLSSNTIGGLKRSLDNIGGVNADSPTPKKQFVEEIDDMEKVEEASLKWPQSNK